MPKPPGPETQIRLSRMLLHDYTDPGRDRRPPTIRAVIAERLRAVGGSAWFRLTGTWVGDRRATFAVGTSIDDAHGIAYRTATRDELGGIPSAHEILWDGRPIGVRGSARPEGGGDGDVGTR